VYIGNDCEIGDNVKIYPGVKIYHNCKIGNNVIIHANAVIGSDGFGFSKDEAGKYIKMHQLGNVVIMDDVEIGANTVIDRASLGSTVIHKGVKLDNLIQVAHNVEIGDDTVMAAQVGVAGSTKIGKNCMVGGQVGFVGHLKVADGAQIQAQSGIAGSVKEENAKLYGYPAIDYNTYLRAFATMKTLPDMAKKLRALEKEIRVLKQGKDD
jgi:UDP-3-O-[3-hydroxymyristoyl] glucosamine N-acyltransferase